MASSYSSHILINVDAITISNCVSCFPVYIVSLYNICRNPDPRSRPQFGQLVSVLAGNSEYLLGWSDEDKQSCSKDAMALTAPLETANDLYYDLQSTYMHTQ